MICCLRESFHRSGTLFLDLFYFLFAVIRAIRSHSRIGVVSAKLVNFGRHDEIVFGEAVNCVSK